MKEAVPSEDGRLHGLAQAVEVQLLERLPTVDEDSAPWGQNCANAFERRAPHVGMAPVQRPHSDGKDNVERKITPFHDERLHSSLADTQTPGRDLRG